MATIVGRASESIASPDSEDSQVYQMAQEFVGTAELDPAPLIALLSCGLMGGSLDTGLDAGAAVLLVETAARIHNMIDDRVSVAGDGQQSCRFLQEISWWLKRHAWPPELVLRT